MGFHHFKNVFSNGFAFTTVGRGGGSLGQWTHEGQQLSGAQLAVHGSAYHVSGQSGKIDQQVQASDQTLNHWTTLTNSFPF